MSAERRCSADISMFLIIFGNAVRPLGAAKQGKAQRLFVIALVLFVFFLFGFALVVIFVAGFVVVAFIPFFPARNEHAENEHDGKNEQGQLPPEGSVR